MHNGIFVIKDFRIICIEEGKQDGQERQKDGKGDHKDADGISCDLISLFSFDPPEERDDELVPEHSEKEQEKTDGADLSSDPQDICDIGEQKKSVVKDIELSFLYETQSYHKEEDVACQIGTVDDTEGVPSARIDQIFDPAGL